MTDTDTRHTPSRAISGEAALREVAAARDWLQAAKQTGSRALIEGAEQDLQTAVDGARYYDVLWGQIGLTLGIARGNAYQRYRKKHTSPRNTGLSRSA